MLTAAEHGLDTRAEHLDGGVDLHYPAKIRRGVAFFVPLEETGSFEKNR